MTIRVVGEAGGGGGGVLLQPHDDTLFGGALAHWSFDRTMVDGITGGAGYDFGMVNERYVPVNGNNSPVHHALDTSERLPGVAAPNAQFRISGAISIAVWVAYLDIPNAPDTSLAIGFHSSSAGAANNSYWLLGYDVPQNRFAAGHQSGTGTDNWVLDAIDNNPEEKGFQHFTFTRDTAGTTLKLYKAGSLVDTNSSATAHTDGSSIGNIFTGGDSVNQDYVAVFSAILYDSELTAPQVQTLYESSIV